MSPGKQQGFEGYTKIPNILLEALAMVKLTNYEARILYAIARKTYGFNKDADFIAQSQLRKLTGIYQSHISRTLKLLISKNIIIKKGKHLSIQKDIAEWQIDEQELLKNIPSEVYNSKDEPDKNIPSEVYKYTKPGINNIPSEVCTKNTTKKKNTKETLDAPSLSIESQNPSTKEKAKEIIDYLNNKTDRQNNYQDIYISLIDNLLKEYSVDQIKHAIDNKVIAWKDDPKMNRWLVPTTLFKPDKFNLYLNERPMPKKPKLRTEELTLNQASLLEMVNALTKDIKQCFGNNGKTTADIEAIINKQVVMLEEAVQIIGHDTIRGDFEGLPIASFPRQIKERIEAREQGRKANRYLN